MFKYLCLLGLVLGVRCSSAPFITPCRSGDTPCIQASAQAALPVLAVGIPAFGAKPLDPLHLDLVNGTQGGLTLTFKDSIVTGMKGCIVDGIKHDLSKGKQVVIIRCSVKLNGDYKLDGQLLILPIKGEGKYHIEIQDIIIKTTTRVVPVDGADGKKHWHVADWHYASDVKTGATFNFENLFNGNKILADPVENFVNTNWKDVMHEIAPPIVRAIVSRVVESVEAVYKAVPAEELEVQ